MTSNIGSHLIQENFEHFSEENREQILLKTRNEVYELLKKTIRPEFLNRIDETIMFEPITRENMNKIVEIQLHYVIKTLAEQDIKLTVTNEAIDWLSQLGFDPQFGARPVKRVIQKQVLNELSKAILAGKVKKEQSIQLDMFDNKLVFINQNQPAEISAN